MNTENNIEPDFMKRPKENPFRAPEGYFDSMEDRIMKEIKHHAKPKTTSAKIIRLLKPAFGLAASLLLVALLVYSPILKRLTNNNPETVIAQSPSADLLDNYAFSLISVDDNVLANAIFTDEPTDTSATGKDELLAYLSSDLNEVEIYAEIQNY